MSGSDQSGLLVLSAWVEQADDGADPPLVVRLRWTVTARHPQRGEAVVGSGDEVVAHVRAWLDAVRATVV